jgi:hypothetical protein
MIWLYALLLMFALVLAVIAGNVNPVDPWRGRLLCFSVACIAAAELVKAIPLLH